jgi:hypothetical protein
MEQAKERQDEPDRQEKYQSCGNADRDSFRDRARRQIWREDGASPVRRCGNGGQDERVNEDEACRYGSPAGGVINFETTGCRCAPRFIIAASKGSISDATICESN